MRQQPILQRAAHAQRVAQARREAGVEGVAHQRLDRHIQASTCRKRRRACTRSKHDGIGGKAAAIQAEGWATICDHTVGLGHQERSVGALRD